MTNDRKDLPPLNAIGMWRDGLDHQIKTTEDQLRRRIEGLHRELTRATEYLDKGYRVNSAGVCQGSATDIDQACAILGQLYDLRNGYDAAAKYDAKGGGE